MSFSQSSYFLKFHRFILFNPSGFSYSYEVRIFFCVIDQLITFISNCMPKLHFQCFTILWQDRAGGLQVRNTAGKWVDAVPIPGTLVLKYVYKKNVPLIK